MKKKIILGYLIVIFAILVVGMLAKEFILVDWQSQLFTVVFGIGVGLTLAYIFSNSLMRDVNKLVESSKVISGGDLTEDVAIVSRDEIGVLVDAFNGMIRNLRNLVGKVKTTSNQIAEASSEFSGLAQEMKSTIKEISTSVENISKGAEKQSGLVENTSENIKQVAGGTETINEKVKLAAKKAEEMASRAREAEEASRSTLSDMEQVFGKIDASMDLVKRFVKKTGEIHKIVGLITEISQQTNLLALNATIESSRAGEFGAGFTVVADEIRKLAETTRDFAENIKSIVENIQEEHHAILDSFASVTGGVNEGRTVLKNISGALNTIAVGVIDMVGEVKDISSVTETQAGETEKMVRTMEEVARLAEDNAAATEETAAATEQQTTSMDELASLALDLSVLADDLKEAASRFMLPEGRPTDEETNGE